MPAKTTRGGPAEAEESRKPVGRSTKYEPRFCEEVVAFCRQGYSITGFAGSIGVCRATITEWAVAHPKFSAAVKAAKAAAALAYEEDAFRIREKGGGPGAATIVIFGLKNMAPDDYRDKQDFERSGKGGSINVVISNDDAEL